MQNLPFQVFFEGIGRRFSANFFPQDAFNRRTNLPCGICLGGGGPLFSQSVGLQVPLQQAFDQVFFFAHHLSSVWIFQGFLRLLPPAECPPASYGQNFVRLSTGGSSLLGPSKLLSTPNGVLASDSPPPPDMKIVHRNAEHQ